MIIDGLVAWAGASSNATPWDDIEDLYDLPDGPAPNLPAHYNIAPTDPVQVVRRPAAVKFEWVGEAKAS
jgi:putative SOS response-associated peptidase YedK